MEYACFMEHRVCLPGSSHQRETEWAAILRCPLRDCMCQAGWVNSHSSSTQRWMVPVNGKLPSDYRASLMAQLVKNLPVMWETWLQSLGWEDTLEKGKATHCSILAWRSPWTVQAMGSQRVRHDWATITFTLRSSPTPAQGAVLCPLAGKWGNY